MEAGALAYSGPKEARPVLEALMYELAVNLNGLSPGSLTGRRSCRTRAGPAV